MEVIEGKEKMLSNYEVLLNFIDFLGVLDRTFYYNSL